MRGWTPKEIGMDILILALAALLIVNVTLVIADAALDLL